MQHFGHYFARALDKQALTKETRVLGLGHRDRTDQNVS